MIHSIILSLSLSHSVSALHREEGIPVQNGRKEKELEPSLLHPKTRSFHLLQEPQQQVPRRSKAQEPSSLLPWTR